MKKILIVSATVVQCALIAMLVLRTSDIASTGLAVLVLTCLIGVLWNMRHKGSKEDIVVDGGRGQSVDVQNEREGAPQEEPQEPSNEKGGGFVPSSDEEQETSYFQNYLVHIAAKVGEDASSRIKADVEAILGSDTQGRIDEILAQPQSKNRAKGLVVGRVQSGKTQNYTGLITRAIDEGWNTVVVLTSNNTALESQTISRLRKDLAASDLTEEKYELIDNFLEDELPSMNGVAGGKIYIGFALKQADHLRGRNGNGKGVIGWLRNNEWHLASANIMVIDDEADNATQNTVVGASDWSDESVLRYAENVRQEGISTNDEGTLRVSEWITDIASNNETAPTHHDASLNALKAILEDRIGDDEVRSIIRNYAELLHLDKKVSFAGRGADSPIAPQVCGFVENYFTRRGRGRGHSRGDDFRAILRWFLNVRKPRSVINDCIRTLVSPDTFSCGKLAYVGYTATPYANFLNEARGADNPLELDFALPMSIAPEYFGLAKIFGKDAASPSARMPIVRTIDGTEQTDVTKPFMKGMEIGLDENLDYDYISVADRKRKQGSWKTLKDSIKWAIVAAAIRRGSRIDSEIAEVGAETRSARWTTMLVNLSREIGNHNGLREAIQNYLANKMDDVASFKKECLAVFDERAKDIDAVRFARMFPDYPHKVHNPSRATIEKHLDYVLNHVRVIALNSDAENISAYCDYIQDVPQDLKRDGDWLWIVVGGNRISRGLTFDGLVSSYFDRDGVSVNVDTLTQMGRWFGYRIGYELLPRVWMPAGAVASMKEICGLEEDMHTQLHQLFTQNSAKPNPRMLAISRRLTRLDNAAVHEDGVENPMIVREFFSQSKSRLDGIAVVSDFLSACGPVESMIDNKAGKVYARLNKWFGVELEVVKKFFDSVERCFSHPEMERLSVALGVMKEIGELADVVLSNPMNKKQTIDLTNGMATHPHGISECETLEDGSVRFGKFSGQYDAWKAVVPKDIVEDVEKVYGVRANTFEAIGEMFARKEARGIENRPVVQIGFIEVEGLPVPYVSVYCPGKGLLSPVRISGDETTVGQASESSTASELTADMTKVTASVIDASLANELVGRNYRSVSTFSTFVKRFLYDAANGKVAMLDGYGIWKETRSGYGTGSAVFRTEWAGDGQAFLNKIIDEATCAVATHVKANPVTVFQANDLWRTVTKGKYNGILEPTGKHVLPLRNDDHVVVRRLMDYGISCVDDGAQRPKIKAA